MEMDTQHSVEQCIPNKTSAVVLSDQRDTLPANRTSLYQQVKKGVRWLCLDVTPESCVPVAPPFPSG